MFAKAEKPPDRKSRAIQLATEDEKKAKAQAEHLKLQLADKEDETREVRQRLVTIETESRAVHRRLTTTIEEVKIWKVKSEATEERLSQSLAKLAVEEQKLLDVQKLADKKDVEITTATRKLITAIEEVKVWKIKSEATEEKFGAPSIRLAERWSSSPRRRRSARRRSANSRTSGRRWRRRAGDAAQGVHRRRTSSRKSKTESVEERLQQASPRLPRRRAAQEAREGCTPASAGEGEPPRRPEEAFAALKTSEEAAQALRESESMLTAAVESNAVTIKDLRAQLDAMRIDRDKEKTNAKESRVQNGVLRMRLAASTAGMTSSTDEVEQLRKSVKSLENTQLERAAEEVRKIAKLEGARDEAAAADRGPREEHRRRGCRARQADPRRATPKSTSSGRRSTAQHHGSREEGETPQGAVGEQGDGARVMIIKETELRETRGRETLKRDAPRRGEPHGRETHRGAEAAEGGAHARPRSGAQVPRAAEAAIAAEEERRRADARGDAALAAEMEKRAAALHDRIAEPQGADRRREGGERGGAPSQYDRTADSAAEALKALKAEVAQLNEQLESLEDDRRVDKIAADERVAEAQDIAAQEKKAMQEALKAERASARRRTPRRRRRRSVSSRSSRRRSSKSRRSRMTSRTSRRSTSPRRSRCSPR